LAGALDLQVAIQGRNPPQNAQDIDRFLAEGEVDFTTHLALSRVALALPMQSLDLKGVALRLDADGNTLEQHLSVETKAQAVRVEMSGGKKESPTAPAEQMPPGSSQPPPRQMFASGFSASLDGVNTFAERPKLAELIAKMRTEVSVRAGVATLEKDGVAVAGGSAARISVDIAQEGLQRFELRKLEGNLPEIGLGVSVQGTTSLDQDQKPRDFVLDTKVSLARAEALHVVPGLATQGGLSAALRVASGDMKKVEVTGHLDFDRFGLWLAGPNGTSEPKFVLEDMNGTVPIVQSLSVPLDQFLRDHSRPTPNHPASLAIAKSSPTGSGDLSKDQANSQPKQPDDYRRDVAEQAGRYLQRKAQTQSQMASKAPNVDYGSVKPFYPNRKPLTIKRVIAANIEMLAITLDMEWREDMVGMNEFVIGVLGGQLQGNVQISLANDVERIMAKPKEVASFVRKIYTNIQATRLDTRKILDRLPGASGGGDAKLSLFSDPYIDATIHYLWNLESRDLGGSIDITTIGKEQVRMLLSYIDPSKEDPTINDIRKGLYLGEVRQVSIPIKNGEIGLDVDIRALSVPIPTPKLSRFPISQLIDNAVRKGDKNATAKGRAA
jgi:hypothetical protein